MGKYHDEFISALSEKSFEKAIRIAEHSEYQFFYQYRVWDDYTITNIREGNIILSNPLDFNDIFDLFYKVSWEKIFISEHDDKVNKLFQMAKQYDGDGFEEIKKSINEKFVSELEKIVESDFISCFSIDPCSVPMWGHYTDKYSGYCAEYAKRDLLDLCFKNKDLFGEVNYINSMIDIDNRTNLNEKLIEASFTKHIDWDYENEWRMFAVNYDKSRVNLSVGKHGKIIESGIFPKRILLGCKMEDNKKELIREVCKEKNIECIETRKSYDEYKIIVL